MADRYARMVGHGLTLLGAVRVIGEMVLVPHDQAHLIPSEADQVRRWGEIKVEWAPDEAVEAYEKLQAPAPSAPPPEPSASEAARVDEVAAEVETAEAVSTWASLSGEDLLTAVTGMGDAQLEKFLAWASSEGASEDARIIAKQFA